MVAMLTRQAHFAHSGEHETKLWVLQLSEKKRDVLIRWWCSYLCVPKVSAEIVALFAKLQGNNFVHGFTSSSIEH
jgi:hypothetical protein